jgi:hypothetical protein
MQKMLERRTARTHEVSAIWLKLTDLPLIVRKGFRRKQNLKLHSLLSGKLFWVGHVVVLTEN